MAFIYLKMSKNSYNKNIKIKQMKFINNKILETLRKNRKISIYNKSYKIISNKISNFFWKNKARF